MEAAAKQKFKQAGPWDNEPDELFWTDEKTGMECHVCRNHSGAWCGYVRIPEDHPLRKLAYNDTLPSELNGLKEAVLGGPTGKRGVLDVFCLALGSEFRVGLLFDVHGGITFSGDFDTGGYWYGFDCSHSGDLSPAYPSGIEGEYRDLAYVKAECASLAKQLRQVSA